MLAKLEISSEFFISEFCFSVLLMKKARRCLVASTGFRLLGGTKWPRGQFLRI